MGVAPCMLGDKRDRDVSLIGAPIGLAGRLEGNGEGVAFCCFAAGVTFDAREGEVAGFLLSVGDLAEVSTGAEAMTGALELASSCAVLALEEGREAEIGWCDEPWLTGLSDGVCALFDCFDELRDMSLLDDETGICVS